MTASKKKHSPQTITRTAFSIKQPHRGKKDNNSAINFAKDSEQKWQHQSKNTIRQQLLGQLWVLSNHIRIKRKRFDTLWIYWDRKIHKTRIKGKKNCQRIRMPKKKVLFIEPDKLNEDILETFLNTGNDHADRIKDDYTINMEGNKTSSLNQRRELV